MKRAIVSGVGGQDGYYMAKLLLEKGYDVVGLVHSISVKKDIVFESPRYREIAIDFKHYHRLIELVEEFMPDEIYNFGAQSSSIGSWDDSVETFELNMMAPISFLQGVRDFKPKCRYFQASSCEIFGSQPSDFPQNEKTNVSPETPYATAKAAAAMSIKNFRDKYGIFAVNGILYNHESVRRKTEFLSVKVAQTVADIKMGKQKCLYVGNINSERDFGYAPDFVKAAWETLQILKPDDYIISTNELHSVREMIEIAFDTLEMPIKWNGEGVEEVGVTAQNDIVVRIDPKYYRNYDRCNSLGDNSKIKDVVGWSPSVRFEEMVRSMVLAFCY